jgi:hypothetical protein
MEGNEQHTIWRTEVDPCRVRLSDLACGTYIGSVGDTCSHPGSTVALPASDPLRSDSLH